MIKRCVISIFTVLTLCCSYSDQDIDKIASKRDEAKLIEIFSKEFYNESEHIQASRILLFCNMANKYKLNELHKFLEQCAESKDGYDIVRQMIVANLAPSSLKLALHFANGGYRDRINYLDYAVRFDNQVFYTISRQPIIDACKSNMIGSDLYLPDYQVGILRTLLANSGYNQNAKIIETLKNIKEIIQNIQEYSLSISQREEDEKTAKAELGPAMEYLANAWGNQIRSQHNYTSLEEKYAPNGIERLTMHKDAIQERYDRAKREIVLIKESRERDRLAGSAESKILLQFLESNSQFPK